MRALRIAVAVFIVVALGCAAAWSAELYSAQVSGVQVDDNSWQYTLANTSSSQDYTAMLLQIQADSNTQVLSTTSPYGWRASLDDQTPYVVVWSCWDQDLAAGSALSGFGAKFSSNAGSQGWTVMFENSVGETPVAFDDLVTPEPGAAVAILIGLTSLVALTRRRRS